MEYLKQMLKTNNADLGRYKELFDIFEILSNQQEMKNIYKKINKFLENIEADFSIWKYNSNKNAELVWCKGDKENVAYYSKKKELFTPIQKNKKPLIEFANEGFYMMLPIISREEVIGYFCLHEEKDYGEKWADIYVVVQMLGFILKYYEMAELIKEVSIIDVVTGLFNYRHFRIQINLEIEKAKRFKKALTLAVLKIKDFDQINFKFGFEGGEEVLKEFGLFLQNGRKTDMPARLNDETFAVLLYETDLKGAQSYIRRLKNYFNEVPMSVNNYKFNIELEYNLVEYEKSMSGEEFLEEGKKI